jgi:AbrB family looped-hinge helix DNA binding protein
MQTVVSSKGQVVIPSKIRKELNLYPGQRLNLVRRGSSLVLSAEDSGLDAWLKSRHGAAPLTVPLHVDRSASMPVSKVL